MSWITKLLGIEKVIDTVIDGVDNFIETPDEKRAWKEIKAKYLHETMNKQAMINMIEAQSSSIFKSGWRPALAWICVFFFFWNYGVVVVLTTLGIETPIVDVKEPMSVLYALLGIAGYRTIEKLKKVEG